MRLRLLLPGGRGGGGLGGLRAALAAAAAAAALLAGCGDEAVVAADPQRPPPVEPPVDTRGLRIGLTEPAPSLIAPGPVHSGFTAARDQLAALRPSVLRVLVDWKKLQPTADAPVDTALALDGCMRGVGPCAPSSGLRDLLRAVKQRQAADGEGWEVMVVPYGTPDWAVDPAEGCGEDRVPRLEPYRAMVRAVRDVARAEGVRLRWWSPWNEPNHPTFLGPQRTECRADAPGLAPDAYARLARALAAEVAGESELILGEVAGYVSPRPTAMGSAEFIDGLPQDVACSGAVWGQHAYVRAPTAEEERADGDRGDAAEVPSLAGDADTGASASLLGDVAAALDAKGCERRHRIWITETGVGGPRTGEDRPTGPEALAAQCRTMDAALRGWASDPRVDVALQYTFREDPVFRVGLADGPPPHPPPPPPPRP